MEHVLIDKEHILDANLYAVRNELEERLAALVAGNPVDPVQLAKDQSVMITNMVTLTCVLSGGLNDVFSAFDEFNTVHSEFKKKMTDINLDTSQS